MASNALLNAESNAVSRLISMATRIEETVLNLHYNRDEGEEPTWDNVRKIETAEYLLSRVFHYIDSGEPDDEIDITWTWKEVKENHDR